MNSRPEHPTPTGIRVLWPNVCTGAWVSHIAASLAEEMAAHVPVKMHVRALLNGFTSPVAVPAVPVWATRAAFHFERHRPFINQRTTAQFLNAVSPGEVCWLWPPASARVVHELKRRGHTVVLEAINCHQRTAKRIVADAHTHAGLAWKELISDEAIADEDALFAAADAIFAPSPRVAQSLLENGIPEEKILHSSYGWSPARFRAREQVAAGKDFSALFVGSVCVRKGAHLLAAAWRDAAVPGTLRFAGCIDKAFAGHETLLATAPSVQLLGHREDVPALMQSASVFAFPTLEEGSPLVIYEAAANGMAILTSPMGAGAIIRDGIEGIVCDPCDHDAWVRALRLLASDPAFRQRLGEAARRRADEFTWQKVAARRFAQLQQLCAVNTPEAQLV